jgi:hypothetical protein
MDSRPSKAPNLPVTPLEYDRQHLDQFKNMLRMYFVEVDANSQQVIQNINNLSVSQWLGELL